MGTYSCGLCVLSRYNTVDGDRVFCNFLAVHQAAKVEWLILLLNMSLWWVDNETIVLVVTGIWDYMCALSIVHREWTGELWVFIWQVLWSFAGARLSLVQKAEPLDGSCGPATLELTWPLKMNGPTLKTRAEVIGLTRTVFAEVIDRERARARLNIVHLFNTR